MSKEKWFETKPIIIIIITATIAIVIYMWLMELALHEWEVKKHCFDDHDRILSHFQSWFPRDETGI